MIKMNNILKKVCCRLEKFFALLLLFLLLEPCAYSKETITIKDLANRDVAIPKEVERVVPLSSSLRYIVYLQVFEKVVGIEGLEKEKVMRGNPATGKAYWLAIKDRLHGIPSIGEGGPGKLPDFERLISVKPDVVITYEPENAQLIQLKTRIPAIVIHYAGTQGFQVEDIQSTISFLGKLLNRETRAEELNKYIQGTVDDLKARTKDTQRSKIYIGGVGARGPHGITSTEAQYPPTMWLNVNNLADETGLRGHVFIDKEKLLSWNPDYIFIDVGGINLIKDDYLKNKEFYKQIMTNREGKVYSVFPYNFYRTNLEIMFANSYFIGKIVYPNRFKDVDPIEKAREIFRQFLGVDVFDDLSKSYDGYKQIILDEKGITFR